MPPRTPPPSRRRVVRPSPNEKSAQAELAPLLARIGERVRAERQRRELTLAQLATASALSRRFLTDVELGKANVSLLALVKIGRALGLDLARMSAPEEAAGGPRSLEGAPATKRRFALIGLRGAGKTTIGRKVAERMKLRFVELDQLVEEAAGMPLTDLFTLHGDAYYRTLEREALQSLLEDERPVLVATGGGIVAAPDTYELLRRHFTTIWLEASPDDHWNRVVEQGDQRPMQGQPAAMARLRQLLADRAPLYGLAHHTIDTTASGLAESVRACEAIARASAPAAH